MIERYKTGETYVDWRESLENGLGYASLKGEGEAVDETWPSRTSRVRSLWYRFRLRLAGRLMALSRWVNRDWRDDSGW